MRSLFGVLITCLCISIAGSVAAVNVGLGASKDNTLYTLINNDTVSNGAGDFVFVGRTKDAELRRTVIAFDISGVPSGATVDSVALTPYRSRGKSNNSFNVSMHEPAYRLGRG